MIFLSHNSSDKDVVGPIAVALANKYGKANVFYDSWSIKPGDSIISEMDAGLENCKFFFFFISENSLKSGMVSLEWQTALNISTNGTIKFIPIKVDNSNQPTILTDKLYIDMYRLGMEQTLQKVIDTIDSTDSSIYNATYNNIVYETINKTDIEWYFAIYALKFVGQQTGFCVSFDNKNDDIKFEPCGSPTAKVFAGMFTSGTGTLKYNEKQQNVKNISQQVNLTPNSPFYFKVKALNGAILQDVHIWEQDGTRLKLIPAK